jgi:plastocyanin
MEEEDKTQKEKEQSSDASTVKKVNPMIFVGVGVIVVLAIGAFLLNQKRTPTPNEEGIEGAHMTQGSAAEESMEGTSEAVNEGDNQINNSSQPAMTDMTVGNESSSQAVEVQVEGGNYYFKPNSITVKEGQPVKITLTSVEGTHDFVIDEFNVKTQTVNADQSTSVEFTPDKTGSFEFYCSVANHRALGMKGTLIVQ